jgi:molybdate/tungstate transport system substrate-binding protein
LLLFAIPFALLACKNSDSNKGEIIIFHAGSLSLPMKAAVDSFTRANPNIKIYLEAAGSVECARKISELGKPCDLFFSADYKVIDKLLIDGFATWSIPFAGNEMSIVYHDKSKYAHEINSSNWFEILQRDDVAYGRSDPNADPCGYRTVMTLRLADMYYAKDGMSDKILAKDNRYIRPKEVDLISMLETGVLDYIFIYKSIAIQHKLMSLALPNEINLSSPDLKATYEKVSVDVLGNTPKSTVTLVGEPMVYGITMPKSSKNPNLAIEFAKFFLSQNGGLAILKQMGQTPVVPSSTASFDSIPEPLKIFALK